MEPPLQAPRGEGGAANLEHVLSLCWTKLGRRKIPLMTPQDPGYVGLVDEAEQARKKALRAVHRVPPGSTRFHHHLSDPLINSVRSDWEMQVDLKKKLKIPQRGSPHQPKIRLGTPVKRHQTGRTNRTPEERIWVQREVRWPQQPV